MVDNDNRLKALKRENKQQRERADNAEGALVQLYECLELVFRQMVAGLRNKLLALSSVENKHDFRPVLSERTKVTWMGSGRAATLRRRRRRHTHTHTRARPTLTQPPRGPNVCLLVPWLLCWPTRTLTRHSPFFNLGHDGA